MNAEIAGRSESGQKSLIGPSKKFRSRAGFPKMLAAFFCAFSVMSYTAIVYTAAEKAVHGAYAEHMISGILRKSDPGDAIRGDGDEEINGNFVLNGSTDDRESDPKNEEAPRRAARGSRRCLGDASDKNRGYVVRKHFCAFQPDRILPRHRSTSRFMRNSRIVGR